MSLCCRPSKLDDAAVAVHRRIFRLLTASALTRLQEIPARTADNTSLLASFLVTNACIHLLSHLPNDIITKSGKSRFVRPKVVCCRGRCDSPPRSHDPARRPQLGSQMDIDAFGTSSSRTFSSQYCLCGQCQQSSSNYNDTIHLTTASRSRDERTAAEAVAHSVVILMMYTDNSG
ncbi:uncharacterized protein M421DRAFT_303216 [Didymella exigua CBS 183.55]|uniref:Uncharacterized protein n=1 Tax=Didymella exigua CBS 183.55 TaxID=1150837 RepID=A0A6A5R6T6_9PLEO|nr:uncharacterized protein M421DRAFT_303216 [Didymella exigua CBS 183.55]KAF1923855.1 hypothetical protein M421DRAFT_303216 [Didymella exigua CBS 183.55]